MEQVERVLQLVRESLAVPGDGDARITFFLLGLSEVLRADGAALLHPPVGTEAAPSIAVGDVPAGMQRQAAQIISAIPKVNGHGRGVQPSLASEAFAAMSIWLDPVASARRQGLLIVRAPGRPAFVDDDRQLLTSIHAQCQFLLVGADTGSMRRLTPRQREIVKHLCEGMTEQAVAGKLCISPHTVHSHVKSIYASLNVSSRAELCAKVSGAHGAPFDVGL